jgi:hypothetical protein
VAAGAAPFSGGIPPLEAGSKLLLLVAVAETRTTPNVNKELHLRLLAQLVGTVPVFKAAH